MDLFKKKRNQELTLPELQKKVEDLEKAFIKACFLGVAMAACLLVIIFSVFNLMVMGMTPL